MSAPAVAPPAADATSPREAWIAVLARLAHAAAVAFAAALPLSLSITQIGLAVALGATAAARALGDRARVGTPLLVPVLLLAGAAAASVLVAWAAGFPPVDPARSLLWKAMLTPAALAWALDVRAPGEGEDAPRRRAVAALGAWSAAALVVAAVAAIQPWTGFDPIHALGLRTPAFRVPAVRAAWPHHFHAVGFYGWYTLLPEDLVPPLAVALALALAAPLPRRTRALLGAAAIGAAAASLLSLARVAWLSLGAVVAVVALASGGRRARALVAAGAAAAALALLVPGVRQRLEDGVTLKENADRALIWRACGDVLRAHPLTGIGLGNWSTVSAPLFDRLDPGRLIPRTGCHDEAFTLLVEGGPLAAEAFAAYWLLLGRAFLRARRAADALGRAAAAGGLAALAGAIANGLVQDTFHASDVAYSIGFAIAVAWVLAAPAPSPSHPARAGITAGTAAARSPT